MDTEVRSRVLRWVLLGGGSLLLAAAIRAQFAPGLPNAPKALWPSTGNLILQLNGKGKQIYVCRKAGGVYAWQLKGPEAKLFAESGDLAGRHYAGPTWEANDGSRISGKLAASVPSPDSDSIPWLLLTVTSHGGGKGILSRAQSIQRLYTKGGTAPATGCSVGAEDKKTAVPYEARYYFYGDPQGGLYSH